MRLKLPLALAFAATVTWCQTAPGTRIDLARQGKNPDFSLADFTKPFKSGSALPVSCSTAEVFFHTGEPAGQNVYLCTSADSWTKLTGAASDLGGLATCKVDVQDGAARLAAGCGAALGSQPLLTLPQLGEVRPSAGDGTIWFYFLDGTFVAGFDVTAACSGGIVCRPGVSLYPPGAIPFARVQVTSGVPGAVADDRGWRGSHIAAGPGIRIDDQAGAQTISADLGYQPLSGNGIDVDAVGSNVTFTANCAVLGCLGAQNTWAGAPVFCRRVRR